MSSTQPHEKREFGVVYVDRRIIRALRLRAAHLDRPMGRTADEILARALGVDLSTPAEQPKPAPMPRGSERGPITPLRPEDDIDAIFEALEARR